MVPKEVSVEVRSKTPLYDDIKSKLPGKLGDVLQNEIDEITRLNRIAGMQRVEAVKTEALQIGVPDGMGLRDAAGHLVRLADEEDSDEDVDKSWPALPWSVAFAMQEVARTMYSAVRADVFPGLEHMKWLNCVVKAPKGDFSMWIGPWELAGLGMVAPLSSWNPREGWTSTCRVRIVRKRRHLAHEFISRVEDKLNQRDLFAGGAVLLEPDEQGNLRLDKPPKVLALAKLTEEDVVLSRKTGSAFEAEVLLPITDPDLVESRGVPSRRGALFMGRPGTGKTLSSRIAARAAADRNWSVFYLPDARAVEVALRIAAAHAPALLVCEDIDRQVSGPRDASVDRILNALDGLDRSARVVFIATTNAPEKLPPALLRPGRLDTILHFEEPDEDAGERLLRKYLGKFAPEHMNGAGAACNGLLPASIREVASRSILHAAKRGAEIPDPEDIRSAAMGVRDQQTMLEAAERGAVKPLPGLVIHMAKGGETPLHGAELLKLTTGESDVEDED